MLTRVPIRRLLTITALCWVATTAGLSLEASATPLDDQLLALATRVAQGLRGKAVRRLNVLDFVSDAGEQTTATKYITEQFRTQLLAVPLTCQLVDRDPAIRAESDEQKKLAKDGLLDEATRSTLQQAGVDTVLLGTITHLAASAELNIKVLDVKSAVTHMRAKSTIDIPLFAGETPPAPEPSKPPQGTRLTNPTAETPQPPPTHKETPSEKKTREQQEKRRRDYDKRTSAAMAYAAISGCSPGTVSINPRAMGSSHFLVSGSTVTVRALNLQTSPIDISDESGEVVRNLCPGGGITLFRLGNWLNSGGLRFHYIATGRLPDGSLGRDLSETIFFDPNRPAHQSLIWEVHLRK